MTRDGRVGDATRGDGVAALRRLAPAEVDDAVKRATLYARARVRRADHREPALDPANLALSALEDTLAGRRRWQPARRDLLAHLAMTIDSRVSHWFASPRAAVLGAGDASESAEQALPSPHPTPEEAYAGARSIEDLERYVAVRSPRLGPLLALVTRDGLALDETDRVIRALGEDPARNPDRQRVYRQIRALRALVREWQANEVDGLTGGGDR